MEQIDTSNYTPEELALIEEARGYEPDTIQQTESTLATPPQPRVQAPQEQAPKKGLMQQTGDVLSSVGSGISNVASVANKVVNTVENVVGRAAFNVAGETAELASVGLNKLTGGLIPQFNFKPLTSKDTTDPYAKGYAGVEDLAEPFARFAIGFAVTPGGKAKAVGWLGKFGEGLVKGAVVDSVIWDKSEGNLSSIIDNYPQLKNPITSFLATNPNDNEAISGLKNALEGGLLGAGVNGVGLLIGGLSKMRTANALRKAGFAEQAEASLRGLAPEQEAKVLELQSEASRTVQASYTDEAGNVIKSASTDNPVLKSKVNQLDAAEYFQEVATDSFTKNPTKENAEQVALRSTNVLTARQQLLGLTVDAPFTEPKPELPSWVNDELATRQATKAQTPIGTPVTPKVVKPNIVEAKLSEIKDVVSEQIGLGTNVSDAYAVDSLKSLGYKVEQVSSNTKNVESRAGVNYRVNIAGKNILFKGQDSLGALNNRLFNNYKIDITNSLAQKIKKTGDLSVLDEWVRINAGSNGDAAADFGGSAYTKLQERLSGTPYSQRDFELDMSLAQQEAYQQGFVRDLNAATSLEELKSVEANIEDASKNLAYPDELKKALASELEATRTFLEELTPLQAYEQKKRVHGYIQQLRSAKDADEIGSIVTDAYSEKNLGGVQDPDSFINDIDSAAQQAEEALKNPKQAQVEDGLDAIYPQGESTKPSLAQEVTGSEAPLINRASKYFNDQMETIAKNQNIPVEQRIAEGAKLLESTKISKTTAEMFKLDDPEFYDDLVKTGQMTAENLADVPPVVLALTKQRAVLEAQYKSLHEAYKDLPLDQYNEVVVKGFKDWLEVSAIRKDVGSGAGRALLSLKVDEFAKLPPRPSKYAEKLQQLADADPQTAKNIVEQAIMMSKVNSAKNKVLDVLEGLIEYRTAAMLSSMNTHVINITGNGLQAFNKPLSRFLGGIPPLLVGNTAPIQNGLDNFVALGATVGDTLAGISQKGIVNTGKQIVGELTGAIEYKPLIPSEFDGKSAIPGVLGKVTNLPFRALSIADDYFKRTAIATEARLEGMEIARAKGFSMGSPEWEQTVKGKLEEAIRDGELQFNPDGTPVNQRAFDSALEATFTQDTSDTSLPVRGMLAVAGSLRNSNSRELRLVGKWLTPFINVPANIAQGTIDASPIAYLISPRYRKLFNNPKTRDEAVGKTLMGATFMAGASMAYMNGLITDGGSKDPQLQKTLTDTGWRPYSIKLGDTYIPYDRVGVAGNVLRLGADAMAVLANDEYNDGESPERALAYGSKALSAFMDTNLTQGLTDFMGLFSQYTRDGDVKALTTWFEKQGVSLLPSALKDVNAIIGKEYTNQTPEFGDDIVDRVGLGTDANLPLRHDLLGMPVAYTSHLFRASKQAEQKYDTVMGEVTKMSKAGVSFEPFKLKEINGIPLNDFRNKDGRDAYSVFNELLRGGVAGGGTLGETLSDVINTEDYKQASYPTRTSQASGLDATEVQGGKAMLLKSKIHDYHEAVIEELEKQGFFFKDKDGNVVTLSQAKALDKLRRSSKLDNAKQLEEQNQQLQNENTSLRDELDTQEQSSPDVDPNSLLNNLGN
jgi:hypothetical protein